MLIGAVPAAAQTVTTGNLTGTIEDQQGAVLPGATVVALHDGTGTQYQAVSQANGRFSILNVRVGAYTIRVTMPSFKAGRAEGRRGQPRRRANGELQAAAGGRLGDGDGHRRRRRRSTCRAPAPAATSANEIKETLPTISRSLTDIVRTNSVLQSDGRATKKTPTASVAGRSQRYNSLQIDGAVNNDLFGLAAGGGVPGGAAGTQPISLDAIQEVQLVVSPYDIRQGGFSGGGINAITKSGTNEFHGTAFFFGRNQAWVGDGVDERADFDLQGHAGRLQPRRADCPEQGVLLRHVRLRPQEHAVRVLGRRARASDFGNEALVDRFLSILQNNYAYDLGPNAKDEVTRKTDSDKIFVRADFNLGQSQLTVRHNYVDAINDSGLPVGDDLRRSSTASSSFKSKTNSTVGQLTSRARRGRERTARDLDGRAREPQSAARVSRPAFRSWTSR